MITIFFAGFYIWNQFHICTNFFLQKCDIKIIIFIWIIRMSISTDLIMVIYYGTHQVNAQNAEVLLYTAVLIYTVLEHTISKLQQIWICSFMYLYICRRDVLQLYVFTSCWLSAWFVEHCVSSRILFLSCCERLYFACPVSSEWTPISLNGWDLSLNIPKWKANALVTLLHISNIHLWHKLDRPST